YSFATFIVGATNRFAHAAALGVAESPGSSYNPFFIYGGVGLGKTHLLHAVGNHCRMDGRRVLYVTSEQFTNEFINSIRERRNEEFRSKYRGADILLIDDIQFIADKEQTQEEFFHTFNDLHSSGRQIVVSSDRPPGSLPLLEDRLRSRFEWGLIADIQPPDLETRLAILRAKAEEHAVMVPEDVLDLLARRYQHNIRELEGSLNRIVAYARLTQSPLSADLANLALADISVEANRRPTISAAAVINEVASYFSVRPDELRSKGRTKRVALPRQIAMFLMIEVGQMRIASVGSELGGRDHSTVHHGWQKILAEANSNARLRRDLSEIQNRLFSSQK
ncbi:MAG: chromosomal replication initiator protein DnaA, partial [Chloroflexi bacterium]|nr:chromosomal replication initiator protein DnaA [Chloroflexota bacterium]